MAQVGIDKVIEMAVSIVGVQMYGINKQTEMAYQVEYSEGTIVRVVESKGGWLRKEYKSNDSWVLVGNPYLVKKNKKRDGEKIIETVKSILAA